MRENNAEARIEFTEHDGNGDFIQPTESTEDADTTLDDFNQAIQDHVHELDELDINSIFDQRTTDKAEHKSQNIADHLQGITERLNQTITTFQQAGHPALESVARHKQIALETAYAVIQRKLGSIADGDDLLPPRTAEQLKDEIDGWRQALITIEDDIETTISVNTADIPSHHNNIDGYTVADELRDKLHELDKQRETLLTQAASEEQTPISIPTLRRVMDYGDTLITSQDQIHDAIQNIDTDDELNTDAVQTVETKLAVTARYLADNERVQQTTDEAQDTVGDLLSVIAAARGDNTERMDQQLKELSHGLGDITKQLVEVNHAAHPDT